MGGSGVGGSRAGALATAFVLILPACSSVPRHDACDPIDPVLAGSSFVVVTEPAAGARAASPLRVRGCSRTFESNVVWELQGRDGRALASGFTSGGGVDGADDFFFEASFSTSDPQVGHLRVFEPDVSDGEGFPGGRTVVPLVLLPGAE